MLNLKYANTNYNMGISQASMSISSLSPKTKFPPIHSICTYFPIFQTYCSPNIPRMYTVSLNLMVNNFLLLPIIFYHLTY